MPGFKFKRLFRACVCAGALSLSTAAMAKIDINVTAGSQGEESGFGGDNGIFNPPVKQASGYGFAGPGGGGGGVLQGPLACPGLACDPAASTPGANAAATVNMNVGHFGVSARAWANPPEVGRAYGRTVLYVTDEVFGTGLLTFDIRIDVALGAGSGDSSSDSFGDFAFNLAHRQDQDHLLPFFEFSAWDDPTRDRSIEHGGEVLPLPTSGAFVRITTFWEGPGQGSFEVFEIVPGVFETSIVVPLSFFQGNTLYLEAYNSAAAEAEGSANASVSSLNSGWLGIKGDYTSASGFTYTGFSNPIPEPGTTMLWLLGGGLLALGARRRTTRP